ncbi:MAG: SDR family oxidoreductase [Rhodospirillaceae bacterium]|jgi:NAD(P)-dependent dehydrogenase (short-subunit alcohol dehydrogenase family)|nr:SDR family oxidoreductase [Rhodospirillaceae bacterium]MBT5239453.1 SDR family oxidoreductase [Rhodospirillaceae bacterium]MBT5564297.1 SDR family oxidoreductase [Rhodospirillaceae bacterium]MBT6088861.1 SDR family oxidoreductase [Rhodospirillaceae bacterium]MBT6960962.1 SDR family oxidoreductase [Rhodospirillaceae bacterium]
MMLSGKSAVVTNVCHFVGIAAAKVLQAHGALVRCHDVSFVDAAARSAFVSDNPDLRVLDAHTTKDAVDQTAAELNGLDIAVINDFFPALRAPMGEATADDFRQGLEALMVTPFETASAAARHMKPQGKGKVIFVTSAAPLHGLPNYCMYAAGRGGANALALSVAKELARDNIQVNAVAPNYVESESYFPKALLADEKALSKMTSKVPLGRLGKPEEVAEMIAFLASDRSDFITGQIIPVAGGWA